VFIGDVRSRLRDEHESFLEAVEETFAGFDGAFNTELLVVTVVVSGHLIINTGNSPQEIFGRLVDFLSCQPTEDLRDDLM